MPIRRTESGSWVYDLPPVMSSTGKRERRFFPTKGKAEADRLADLERFRLYGTEGRSVHPSEAKDAERAKEVLNGTGLSLFEAARIAKEIHDSRNNSVTLADAWTRHEESRSNKSAAYLRGLAMIRRKIIPEIGSRLVSDLDPQTVEDAIEKGFPTAHGFNLALRTLSPSLATAVRKGWCKENPCAKIEKRDTGRHEISFLTVNQSRAVLAACKDWSKEKKLPEWLKRDATEARPAVALMLFAGIRPGEVSRLDWSDIDMDAKTVFVGNRKAKTDRSRYIEMPETLHEWLATVKKRDRTGKVVPIGWGKIWQLVRRQSGIADLRDVLRHTFATYHLSAYGDVNSTRSIMGHEAGDILFQHYRGAVRKKDAIAFWSITPTGSKPKLKAVS